jgi:predicted XRE-type DNA-binding protein
MREHIFIKAQGALMAAIMLPSDQIHLIVAEKGWNQQRVADHIGVSQSTVNRWLKGSEPEGANRDAINKLYKSIFHGDDTPKVRLLGYIGAGQSIYPVDDGGGEMVDAPPDYSKKTVALRVQGDSMLPAFENGWLIYYSRHLPPSELINRRCVIKLEDGRVMLKMLRIGAKPGTWTLTSSNASDIENVHVEWAAPIDWIKPT